MTGDRQPAGAGLSGQLLDRHQAAGRWTGRVLAQQLQKAPELELCLASGATDVLERLSGPSGVRGELALPRAGLHDHHAETVRDDVVQLACDAAALVSHGLAREGVALLVELPCALGQLSRQAAARLHGLARDPCWHCEHERRDGVREVAGAHREDQRGKADQPAYTRLTSSERVRKDHDCKSGRGRCGVRPARPDYDPWDEPSGADEDRAGERIAPSRDDRSAADRDHLGEPRAHAVLLPFGGEELGGADASDRDRDRCVQAPPGTFDGTAQTCGGAAQPRRGVPRSPRDARWRITHTRLPTATARLSASDLRAAPGPLAGRRAAQPTRGRLPARSASRRPLAPGRRR